MSKDNCYGQLSTSGIQEIIHKIGERTGLPNITVHCFRRWLATDLIKKGVEYTVIQSILGHHSFQTTLDHYFDNNIEKMKYTHKLYVA